MQAHHKFSILHPSKFIQIISVCVSDIYGTVIIYLVVRNFFKCKHYKNKILKYICIKNEESLNMRATCVSEREPTRK